MGKLDQLKAKAKGLVTDNREKIESGLDKAGNLVNSKTGGKHADKIDKGLGKARAGLDRAAGMDGGPDTGPTPPTPAPPGPPMG